MSTWIVTGGIGTGKTSACQSLRAWAAGNKLAWFSADQAVHQAYERPEVQRQLAAVLGWADARPEEAGAFRARVREAVVRNKSLRAGIESVLHPLVWIAYTAAAEAAKQVDKVLVAEIPLYYETGAVVSAEKVIVVAASRTTQLGRLQSLRSLDERTAEDMLMMQMPLEHKIERADVVIWNDGSVDALDAQVKTLLRQDHHFNLSHMEEATKPAVELAEAPAAELPPTVAPTSDVETRATVPATEAGPTKPEPPFPEEQSINDLQAMSPAELQALAETIGWRTNASRNKHQLIYDLMVWMSGHRTKLKVDGVIDVGPEGFGLIRYPKYSFAPLPEDIFVPSFLVRKFGLRAGQRITGFVKAAKDKEKYAAVERITEIEGMPVEQWEQPTPFDKLTALFPSERIILETPKDPSVSARVVDLVAPLGKGQRALIMASPRSGKTILLKEIAKSITVNHPEITLIVLLLDERPEEVTDFEESVSNCHIYSSTFDESPKRHTQVAELVSERAKRLVEEKKHVVILLDSITRLARGYNAMQGGKGRTMSGGMDAKALIKPKKFFGAARNVEEGGSLTIIATALVETESKMDDLIFEEFKGTGNMEISLDREMAERRIYPAIHVTKSGTRRDDLLYHPDEFKRIGMIRRQLAAVPAIEALESLIRNLQRTKSNAELLLSGLK